MRRYSRGYLQEKYSASSALFVSETAKLLLSAVYVCTSDAPSDVPAGSPLSKYLHLIRHSLKMAVPAVIYLVMNLLGFLSLAHIDASTFAIVSQMKVLPRSSSGDSSGSSGSSSSSSTLAMASQMKVLGAPLPIGSAPPRHVQ